jgi:L-ascorbate metabolism protein UlaG (beta-lactamase superfamily)
VCSWPAAARLRNPQPNTLVDLPAAAEAVVDGVDGLLVTHLHLDHFDRSARELIPPETPVLHQPADRKSLEKHGFTHLTEAPAGGHVAWLGLDVTPVAGEHGFGLIARLAGPVTGFVLRSGTEPTLYIAGDTVWCERVETALRVHQPDVIVVNAGDARTARGKRLVMDGDDVEHVLSAAPASTVVAVHLEALSHCVSTRSALQQSLQPRYGSRLLAPADGETLFFTDK